MQFHRIEQNSDVITGEKWSKKWPNDIISSLKNIKKGNGDGNKLTTPVKKMTLDNDNENTADNDIIRFALVLHHRRRWLLR